MTYLRASQEKAVQQDVQLRNAICADAATLAKLIDIAGEGIPRWLWSRSATTDQDPLDIGTARAQREEGGFSYRNAIVAEQAGHVLGMVLSYPILEAPGDDPKDLPEPIAPFIELERQSVGTWYVNALATLPGHRGCGIGTLLLRHLETVARAQGFQTLSIQVFEQNTGALNLYQRLGYQYCARAAVLCHPCHPYYTGNVLLLKKTVT